MSFPDFLLGDGLYKLGYVTNDLDWAVEHCRTALGFEGFLRFEPSPHIRRADGRSGAAHLRCAFSIGRERVVELMQPLDGLVDIWADLLAGVDTPTIRFHHVGVIVDNIAEVIERAADVGMRPVQQSSVPGVLSVAYLELPGLGHRVELVQYDQGVGGVLADARAMRPSSEHGR
jgi:hypothetical protein